MRSPSKEHPVITTRRALIAFGSNLGDREALIAEAICRISDLGNVERVSGIYATAPMYVEGQPEFLNGALILITKEDPVSLLRKLKRIEREVGRLRRFVNGPREIDLDIIDIEGVQIESGPPIVPHPRAQERRFVLEPLNEIAPNWTLNGYGSVGALLTLPDIQSQAVERVADAPVFVQRG